jgi:hypothetical protein
VGGHGLGMAPLACLGQYHVDAAPVPLAAAPFHQAVPGQPVDQTGQRTLAQVDGWTPQLWGILLWLIPRGEQTRRGERRFDIPGALTITTLGLITGVAAIGAAVALSGLRRRPGLEAEPAGGPAAADLPAGGPAAADLPAGAPALQEAGLVGDRPAAAG